MWRRDGKELYYHTPDRRVMAVDVVLDPIPEFGNPRLLFQIPGGNDVGRWIASAVWVIVEKSSRPLRGGTMGP